MLFFLFLLQQFWQAKGVTTLKNVPVLSDVFTMNNVVRGLNAQVTFNEEENTVVVDAQAEIIRGSAL